MEKEERSAKVQRLSELFCRNECFRNVAEYTVKSNFPPYYDFIRLWEKEGDEYWKLHHELYPEPPKDLMEDVKRRMEAYKMAKDDKRERATFIQKIKVFLKLN